MLPQVTFTKQMLATIQQNHALIEQAIVLLSKTPEATYVQPCEEVFSSSIGQHMRHCIEHYDELFAAKSENRVVRYHTRPRNLDVETDLTVAVKRLRFICNQLERLSNEDSALEVSDCGVAEPAKSSLCRELEFLISHTVHHFALITVISNKLQIEVPKDFGIAPTTLRYREPH